METTTKSSRLIQSVWFMVGVWLFCSLTNTFIEDIWNPGEMFAHGRRHDIHYRSKRFIEMTSDRRLNLPPKSSLSLETTFSLPGFNPLPTGLSSETAISIPFDIDFDKLGMTSEENTFGSFPFLDDLFSSISSFMGGVSPFRAFSGDALQSRVTGGSNERSVLYQVIEDSLSNIGINGKACLLRTICEVHAEPLFGNGLLGEFVELLLSASSSPTGYLHMLAEYVEAEISGKSKMNCSAYHKECPLSLFGALTKEQHEIEQSIRENFIEDEFSYLQDEDHKTDVSRGNSKKSEMKKYTLKQQLKMMKRNETTLKSLSREKRFIFFGPAGRLTLPEGAIIVFKPEISLPFFTNLPKGYYSKLNIGVPFRVIFNDLGLTSVLNPFLRIPFLRKKRDTWKPLPGVNYEGGDRELIYAVLEQMLLNWGINGEQCVLRAICEAHLSPIGNYGLFGEALQTFLTPSRSTHAQVRLQNYVEAEKTGSVTKDCQRFYQTCSYSIFMSHEEQLKREELLEENELLEN